MSGSPGGQYGGATGNYSGQPNTGYGLGGGMPPSVSGGAQGSAQFNPAMRSAGGAYQEALGNSQPMGTPGPTPPMGGSINPGGFTPNQPFPHGDPPQFNPGGVGGVVGGGYPPNPHYPTGPIPTGGGMPPQMGVGMVAPPPGGMTMGGGMPPQGVTNTPPWLSQGPGSAWAAVQNLRSRGIVS